MGVIKTDFYSDISGGHCHGGTLPVRSLFNVRINGNRVMLCGLSSYSAASCGDNNHIRLCSFSAAHPNIRVNGVPIFTSDDFISCGEPAGGGVFPVFAT